MERPQEKPAVAEERIDDGNRGENDAPSETTRETTAESLSTEFEKAAARLSPGSQPEPETVDESLEDGGQGDAPGIATTIEVASPPAGFFGRLKARVATWFGPPRNLMDRGDW